MMVPGLLGEAELTKGMRAKRVHECVILPLASPAEADQCTIVTIKGQL